MLCCYIPDLAYHASESSPLPPSYLPLDQVTNITGRNTSGLKAADQWKKEISINELQAPQHPSHPEGGLARCQDTGYVECCFFVGNLSQSARKDSQRCGETWQGVAVPRASNGLSVDALCLTRSSWHRPSNFHYYFFHRKCPSSKRSGRTFVQSCDT